MKRKLLPLFFALTLLAAGFNANAQNERIIPPTDIPALPYFVDDVVNEIKGYLEQPVEENQYLSFVLSESDFPKFTPGDTLTAAKEAELAQWVKTHPASVEKLLIARKKNYDKYFNEELR